MKPHSLELAEQIGDHAAGLAALEDIERHLIHARPPPDWWEPIQGGPGLVREAVLGTVACKAEALARMLEESHRRDGRNGERGPGRPDGGAP